MRSRNTSRNTSGGGGETTARKRRRRRGMQLHLIPSYQTPPLLRESVLLLLVLLLAGFGATPARGFAGPTSVVIGDGPRRRLLFRGDDDERRRSSLVGLRAVPLDVIDVAVDAASSLSFSASSLIVSSSESWRQYVPLVVSVGVIVDILLGNPLANVVLKPMRPQAEQDEESEADAKTNNKPKSKSRIDAEAVAQQALDKASNTLELRRFLDERKTDYDRMEEMKRKLDASMQDLDEDMEKRQRSIDERKNQ
mmetsp:Transcript_21190/g.50320  ORF Transcript_21190/g.50320 Transcript_21190/m.50320 type:complete len:252 (-) Transcript_21190:256-1011(-)|eukprot:CAMPEP_0197188812 /NCGR_PEP_ID=MMETSP1423-20130617/18561_1 /TAXON_ID=476441 /ORGANISM="Pseudo-nitzschia heimii, Strain UNC1101" /LENGTH=251 /DNA_ID=CAMNT_0042640765 /DNA_START=50 /DNA_END=805 /DNA_ORIENTATION=+